MEYAVRYHDSGTFKGLPVYEERLSRISAGKRITLVAQIDIHDNTLGHLCTGLLTKQQFRLQCELDDSINRITIVNAIVTHPRGPVLEIDQHAAILKHQAVTGSSLQQLVETCVGLGALGQGASKAGWTVQVGNDQSEKFCDHLANLQKQVVCGDICNLQTVVNMHLQSPTAKSMAFGFSCQPFSKLGDKREGEDIRAQCLPLGLYASYLLQMQLVVLECTPTAPSSQFVKRCLQHHEEMTGFLRSEAILDLQGFWPSSRKRWWCVINNGAFGKVYVPPMPQITPSPTISDIIPKFLELNPQELQELTLTGYERDLFSSLGKGFQEQMVDIHGTLPTALHSWGNQCIRCQCGCGREMSFERLRDHGIHGALVAVHNAMPSANIRHLSGREMSLLNGFAKAEGWDDNQRFLTAGVGQLASPLQSCWVFSHVRRQLQQFHFIPQDDSQPKQILACMALDVLRLRDQWYPSLSTVAMDLFQTKIEEMLLPASLCAPTEPEPLEVRPDKDSLVEIDTAKALDAAILTQVIQVEKNTPSPFDPQTGGIVAFSSQGPSHFVQVESQSGESELSVAEPPQKGLQSLANNIINNNLMVFDLIHRQFRAVSVGGTQTVSDFLAAELSITGEKDLQVFSCLGDKLPRDTVLENHQMITLAKESQFPVNQGCEALEYHLSSWPRLQSCLMQNHFVASDEMFYYLQAVSTMYEVESAKPLLIFDLCDVVSAANQWWQKCRHNEVTVTAIGHQHHWIPVRIETNQPDQCKVFTTLEGSRLFPLLQISGVTIEVQTEIETQFFGDCGFQVFAWHVALASHTQVEFLTTHEACRWRFLFWQSLLLTRQNVTVGLCLGGATELETSLIAILKEHGVFPERLTERMKLVISKLGQQHVISALRSQRPWASLKSLANQHSIRLIQPDEFEAVIKDRTKDSKSVASKKKPPSRVNLNKDVVFTPAEVFIPEGVFCQQDGTLLHHLGLRQISPQVKGVVLVTEQEVQPYLTQGNITQQGLGLLVMAPFSGEVEKAGISVRFPAQCRANGDPILLSAILIQKGTQVVSRALPSVAHQVEQIATQTVKFVVYRDQCQVEWDEFCKHPIKYILSVMTCLQVCKQPNCTCGKWHAISEESSEPIVDLWQRDFLTIHFRKTSAQESQVFACFMRVTQSTFALIHRMSGLQGIFVEPRTPDGRRHDESFHTVWMAKQSIDEAAAMQSTMPVETSMVRVSFRYGFRSRVADAAQVHQKVKPDTPFLPGGSKHSFVVGPLPFGVTRKSLTKLFSEWEWSAQAVQPIGRSADMQGLMWMVHASDPPKHTVYTMAHGDLMITRDESAIQRTPKQVIPQVSALTRHQFGSESWDPWANAARKLPSASSSHQVSNAAAIEHVVEQRVLAKLQPREDVNMDSTEHESRINSLESQVQQLVANHKSTEVKTQQVAAQVDALQSQVEGYHGAVQSCIENCIENKLSEQMQKIEALLSKRPRNE